MATLTVRNLPDWVVDALKAQAKSNDRSMEAEVRLILEEQVKGKRVDFFTTWLDMCLELRHIPGPELEIPARDDFGREFSFEE